MMTPPPPPKTAHTTSHPPIPHPTASVLARYTRAQLEVLIDVLEEEHASEKQHLLSDLHAARARVRELELEKETRGFVRSNAPSPETPPLLKTDEGGKGWRHVEMELCMLQLEERIGEVERRVGRLEGCLCGTVCGPVLEDEVHECGSLVQGTDDGLDLRGGMGAGDGDEEYAYGDCEGEDRDQVDGELDWSIERTAGEDRVSQTDATDDGFEREVLVHIDGMQGLLDRLTDSLFAEFDHIRLQYRPVIRNERRTRNEDERNNQHHKPPLEITVARKHLEFSVGPFVIPSAGPGFPKIVFTDYDLLDVHHFPNGATQEDIRDLLTLRTDLNPDAGHPHLIHVVSPAVERELKVALDSVHVLGSPRIWHAVTHGSWEEGKGDTYFVCDKEAQFIYDDDANKGSVCMRGGSGEEEVAPPRTPSFHRSPHALCQHVTSQLGNTYIEYIAISLPPGFIIPLPGSDAPSIVSSRAATVYHFPTGATREFVQQEAWRQKSCGIGHWSCVKVLKVVTVDVERAFKDAIAQMWETMGFDFETLTRGKWAGETQGDTYLVHDRLESDYHSKSAEAMNLRGGSGHDHERPSMAHRAASEEFLDDHNCLLQRMTELQTRNRSLEHELEDYKEMTDSLIGDRNWLMGTQVELEEKAEAAEEEKDAALEELQDLKLRWNQLVNVVAAHPSKLLEEKERKRRSGDGEKSPGMWTRGGGDHESKPASSLEHEQDQTTPSEHSDPTNSISVEERPTFFEFFPRRSTIVFPGSPPQIYQFPSGTTLPQIHEILKPTNSRDDIEQEPNCSRMLEIMQAREARGIQLPNSLKENRVVIAVPKIHEDSSWGCDVPLVAWQTSDPDVDSLETLVERLNINGNSSEAVQGMPLRTFDSEEEDYYEDIGDLLNNLDSTLDDENEVRTPAFCVCATCTTGGRETYFNVRDMQTSPIVSVRGGSGYETFQAKQTSDIDSDGNRLFPLLSPKLTQIPRDPTSRCDLPESEGFGASNEPLSMRLGKIMYPEGFVISRQDDIRRFDWQRTKQLSPQLRNWRFRRGRTYMKSPHCEVWESQFDKHRECCDYCQAVILEEEYPSHLAEDIRHEYEAPTPRVARSKPWEKSTWPDDTNRYPFPVVEDPNPYLRGGAGDEQDLKAADEDWRSEWNDIASQTTYSNCHPRTFRNSSTLSTKTTIPPPSPVNRSLRPHPQTQKETSNVEEKNADLPSGPKWDLRDIDLETLNALRRAGEGESIHPIYYRYAESLGLLNLTHSKTNLPLLMETRRPRSATGDGEFVREIRRGRGRGDGMTPLAEKESKTCEDWLDNPKSALLPTMKRGLGTPAGEREKFPGFKHEEWWENPRPAPTPPVVQRKPSMPFNAPKEKSEESHFVRDIKRWEKQYTRNFNTGTSSVRQQSFKTDKYAFLPMRSYGTGTVGRDVNMSSSPYVQGTSRISTSTHSEAGPLRESRQPRRIPLARLCRHCTKILAMIQAFLDKRESRRVERTRMNSTSKHSPMSVPRRHEQQQQQQQHTQYIPTLPRMQLDKSLPPTPTPTLKSRDMETRGRSRVRSV